MVTDGPYGETKELFGGFYILDVASKEEAVEWAKRLPGGPGSKTEIRRVPSIDEFPQDNEWIQKERAWRERHWPTLSDGRSPPDVEAVAAVWRIESARIVGALARYTGDFALAEDLGAGGAGRGAGVLAARRRRRATPSGWLLDRRAAPCDRRVPAPVGARRAVRRPRSRPGRGRRRPRWDTVPWDPDRIDDDVLALMFISCHPVLSREARVALTLRVVGGLTSDEIARAFLVPTATVQARITRAKKTLAAARVPFEVPTGSERAAAARLRAQRGLRDLHRGVFGDFGWRPDPGRPRERGDPAGAGAVAADAGRVGGARAARAVAS